MRGELYVEDDNTVNPGFDILNSVELLLCSTIGEAKGRVEVCNKVGTEASGRDML
jgi:hypothetical protein